ncbi:hypothetical protein NDU88_003079, partial [Pleurodeles waltl]
KTLDHQGFLFLCVFMWGGAPLGKGRPPKGAENCWPFLPPLGANRPIFFRSICPQGGQKPLRHQGLCV